MKSPLVSVIIPTYKRDVKMLSRALFSVFNQTYQNVEAVVVDDNAGDDLKGFRKNNRVFFDTLDETYKKHLKVVLNKTNLGGALGRNEGIKNASGDYITFLDDDDLFLPSKIEHQISYMTINGLNCSFTDLSIYDENDRLIERRNRSDLKDFSFNSLIKYHLTKGITSTETFMMSKDLLNSIGGFDDKKMGQEFYLMYKVLHYDNLKIGYFPSDDIKAYRTKQEAISNGPNKIPGEKELYKFRKSNFSYLNRAERRYVRCRHRAVLAFAYSRRKRYIASIWYLAFAFITDPILSISEARKRKK